MAWPHTLSFGIGIGIVSNELAVLGESFPLLICILIVCVTIIGTIDTIAENKGKPKRGRPRKFRW